MELGAFSISLAVKNLAASRDFYEKLGFKKVGGDEEHKYLILANGEHLIGIFEGMFEKNILTFNPGLDNKTEKVESYTDVRELQRKLKEAGVKLIKECDESSTGAASITLEDPDGNPILIDQFF